LATDDGPNEIRQATVVDLALW